MKYGVKAKLKEQKKQECSGVRRSIKNGAKKTTALKEERKENLKSIARRIKQTTKNSTF